MHTFGDDFRFIVTTWRRAGSTALCEALTLFIETHNRKPYWPTFDDKPIDNSFINLKNVVCHTHSLERLQAWSGCADVFWAIRNPSEASVSNLIALFLGYWQVYSDKYVDEIHSKAIKNNHHLNVLDITEKHKIPRTLEINISELDNFRIECIKWNNTAQKILQDKQYHIFNYNYWNGNIEQFMHSQHMDIPHDELTIVKNSKRWEDYVINSRQVCEWIESNKHEDVQLMEKWSCHTI